MPTMSLWMRGTSTLVAAYVILYLFDWSLFSWHPLCMTLGYAVLMGEAVRIAIDFRSTEGQERVKRITRHMLVNLGTLALITVGFASIYKNKASIRLGKDHYKSYHAKLGLFVFIMTVFVVAGGLLSFKKLGLINIFPEKHHGLVKTLHRLGGGTTFFLSLVVMELGCMTGAVKKHGVFVQSMLQISIAAIFVMMLVFSAKGSGTGNPSGSYSQVNNSRNTREEDHYEISMEKLPVSSSSFESSR
ncbi:cytochrome b-561-like protein [Chloropicon primus]|uniref:Cytochrome b-561-like protein n=1 Tax=Chloropicon primus TaxID=1764295 RepID=A0A5B8MKT0_9CHLO|nr:cytochrome b-561-like protein [Chloropicon primus]|eukprot:QDZ21076.1 cytochrome b-561-like protein [Chloropicon primus]